MDGANERFMSGKGVWLANHLIVYNVSRATGGANPWNQGLGTVGTELPVQEFDLRKIGSILMETGHAGKEYELRQLDEADNNAKGKMVVRKITSRTNRIRAYFLPWGSSRTYSGRLGTNADYFFTPTINGCSFAHHGGGPNPSVAHGNFVDPMTQLTDQVAINTDMVSKFGFMPTSIVVKSDYKRVPIADEDYRSTVVGFRTGNNWSFYYQNYKAESQGTSKVIKTGLNLCVPIP